MIPNGMIFCAGLGTRLRPMTDRIPKPLLPVLGIPLLQTLLDQFAAAGFQKISINYHYLKKEFENHFFQLEKPIGANTEIFYESSLLGGAGGIRNCIDFFDQKFPILTTNGDVLQKIPFQKIWDFHQNEKPFLTLLIRKKPKDSPYTPIDFDPKTRKILKIGSGDYIFLGTSILEYDWICKLEKNKKIEFLDGILLPALQANSCLGYLVEEPYFWFDIGSPKLWKETNLFFLNHIDKNSEDFWRMSESLQKKSSVLMLEEIINFFQSFGMIWENN